MKEVGLRLVHAVFVFSTPYANSWKEEVSREHGIATKIPPYCHSPELFILQALDTATWYFVPHSCDCPG